MGSRLPRKRTQAEYTIPLESCGPGCLYIQMPPFNSPVTALKHAWKNF